MPVSLRRSVAACALACVAVWLPGCDARVVKDRVVRLPGWDAELPSAHFSGYLSITNTKHLHYYLVESEVDPENAPIVLWLNGGPGCSSIDGLLYEHGPFRVNSTDPTRLVRFEQNWARLANVLYLEAPVGVGFSYSTNPEEYNVDDDSTADDNLMAMQLFFDLYPEFARLPFYITGESYGGVYVPTLAEAIMKATYAKTFRGPVLGGIAVGNGCTGTKKGVCGTERDKYESEYLLGQSFVEPSLKAAIRDSCDFDRKAGVTEKCKELLKKMYAGIGRVNLYNIYGECPPDVQHTLKAPLGENSIHNELLLGGSEDGLGVVGPVACLDSVDASAWINRDVVLKALHVRKPSFAWATCANSIKYTSTRENLPRDTYPALLNFTRVVIYNGDWDACVPYTDNWAWTSEMGFPIRKPWHPWTYSSPLKGAGQVGGYAISYTVKSDLATAAAKGEAAVKGFDFVTIRGGRHEVPETAPNKAFEVLRRLLNQEEF